jgi:hypothetical protein
VSGVLFGLYGPGGGVGSDRFESGCGALGWCVNFDESVGGSSWLA